MPISGRLLAGSRVLQRPSASVVPLAIRTKPLAVSRSNRMPMSSPGLPDVASRTTQRWCGERVRDMMGLQIEQGGRLTMGGDGTFPKGWSGFTGCGKG